MELVNLSWLFAYFINATQAATPNVPRITNTGHLRYQPVKRSTVIEMVSQPLAQGTETGFGGEYSPLSLAVLVSVRVWRSTDEVLRVKRRFRQGVVRSELVDMVVGPRELLLHRASPGRMQVLALEPAP